MLKNSPLRTKFKVTRDSIVHIKSQSFIKPLSAEDGKTGELFEGSNLPELDKKLRDMWKYRGRCMKYSNFCKEKKFKTSELYVEELLKIYEE